jgi:AcrR family transcriptional regulator
MGRDTAKNRRLLVDATERVLCEEGYAALTARHVAEKAGLKAQLVYYYFRTMDELILAVVRRNAANRLERFARTMAAPEPFRALWEMHITPASAISASEMIALANHRESIRIEIVAAARQFRALEIEAVGRMLAIKGVDPHKVPAAGVVTIITALARALVQDSALGLPDGYADAVNLVQQGLEFFRHDTARSDSNILLAAPAQLAT